MKEAGTPATQKGEEGSGTVSMHPEQAPALGITLDALTSLVLCRMPRSVAGVAQNAGDFGLDAEGRGEMLGIGG